MINRRALAIAGVIVACFGSSPLRGQTPTPAQRDQHIVGHLGITAVECDCTFDGRSPVNRDFRFRSDLVILGVDSKGPSAGVVFPGDTIVSIDGIPLRTRRGGTRFANIRPGERVTLGLRRSGSALRVAVTAAAIDADDPSGLADYMPLAPGSADREYDAPPVPGTAPTPLPPFPARRPGQVPLPRSPRAPPAARPPRVPGMPPVPQSPASPDGWFGFSIRCNECGWSRFGGESSPRWESTTFPQIGIVAPGGPADIAGFRSGDRITHVDGSDILSPDGARKFGAVKPRQRVRLTVTRNGTALTRELTLTDRPRASSGKSSLRYTGRLGDVGVEVWSPAGATVERDGDTVTINVGGSIIRLKKQTTPPSGN